MAENDIYNSKAKYEYMAQNIEKLAIRPEERGHKGRGTPGKYYCRNKENLVYFKGLIPYFEAKDLSYVRRVRLLSTLHMICYATAKNLKDCDRNEVDSIVAYMHSVYFTSGSKEEFIKNIKYIWKVLFPEKDEKGRLDDSIIPYPVRHLKRKSDKSRNKLRGDRLTIEEFEKIVDYFSDDQRMQFYLTFSLESLGRPQEILYTKIRDVELYDNYAKIWISEHGKEGTGFLQCIDSYPYLIKWLEKHNMKKNKDAFLFINTGNSNYGKQFTPKNINKKIRIACKYLGIDKPVTAYSIKRNGVTFRRLRGDSDIEIQHAARWTSTKQLNTYDLSNHDDAFKKELAKRGLINDEDFKDYTPKTKECGFCNTKNGFSQEFCSECKRPLNRKKIIQMEKERDNSIEEMRKEVEAMKKQMQENAEYAVLMNKLLRNDEFKRLVKVSHMLENGV